MHDKPTSNVIRLPDRQGRPLSKKQLADRLGRSTRWIELRMREGLPSTRATTGARLFDLDEVRKWLEAERIPRSELEPIETRETIVSGPGIPIGSAARRYGLDRTKPAVYFIQAGDGAVKIGYVRRADGLEQRIIAMQTGNAESLRLLCLIAAPKGVDTERELHERFAADHIRGEWFDPDTPGLLEAIAHAQRVADAPYISRRERKRIEDRAVALVRSGQWEAAESLIASVPPENDGLG